MIVAVAAGKIGAYLQHTILAGAIALKKNDERVDRTYQCRGIKSFARPFPESFVHSSLSHATVNSTPWQARCSLSQNRAPGFVRNV
jgi:hypothetical protein